MAPSRGLLQSCSIRSGHTPLPRWRRFSSLSDRVTDPHRKTQIYVSRFLDPYLNLSIEHYLLQKSASESTILFLYTDRPCVVIGRNQNPWIEVNHALLPGKKRNDAIGPVDLVRRRSGGGTVFHDHGNVNYSVICPTSTFDRDRHAQMIVRALRGLGVHKAKVNERHDIVLATEPSEALQKPLKVSGSAYKLTRLRSVHHGTCLLNSPNLRAISRYLRSPAKAYIKARGVESVSSPIANVNLANEQFEGAAIEEFMKMYGVVETVVLEDDESVLQVPEISKGLAELKASYEYLSAYCSDVCQSLEWIYCQTPQFAFSSHPTEDDSRQRCPPPDMASVSFIVRNGVFIEARSSADGEGTALQNATEGKKLHEVRDWRSIMAQNDKLSSWLNDLLGRHVTT